MNIEWVTAASCLLGYIGPGGGIALLGPLVGVMFAIAGAFGMVAFWPIRALLRRARAAKTTPQQHN